MEMSPEKYIERLNELLRKKKQLLLEISALTQSQTGAISDDGLDRLNQLIEEKQKRIDSIDKLDEEFEVYFQRFKSSTGIAKLDQSDISTLGGAVADGAKQLQKLTAEILEIIRAVSEYEKVNSQKSKDLLESFGNEIRKINQGKKANNAYKPASYSAPSYFLDKKK
jgi:hypothetical protein